MQSTSPSRILLVDDTPTNLKVLSDALRSQGWITLVANDGESAIEQMAYAKPDLILLDVMMPGMDGFETCRRLKANDQTSPIPIIFMTALSDATDKVRGLDLGAVDYITKPFQQEEVVARVKLHLKLSQLSQSLEEHADELERRVEQRTVELSQSLQQLKDMQLQLVQSEKMSTLGQLVAGVAHEINNPIGFIGGNLQPAETYVQDLLRLIDLYRKHYPDANPEIVEEMEAIDLDYLSDDLPKLLSSMRKGVDRIREISISLRTFSRNDSDRKTKTDLHEGLDSTLLILKHRIKANDYRPDIQIIRQYGELPLVACYSSQINQVFMNLLANAIDALDEVSIKHSFEEMQANPMQILIQTSLHADQNAVSICIRDNGLGMPDDVKQKVFDHLFTTKPVGQGTGLGLSISQQIVMDKHGGKLELESTLGQGTEFRIVLPVA
jgi:signal transduction histidine kinase